MSSERTIPRLRPAWCGQRRLRENQRRAHVRLDGVTQNAVDHAFIYVRSACTTYLAIAAMRIGGALMAARPYHRASTGVLSKRARLTTRKKTEVVATAMAARMTAHTAFFVRMTIGRAPAAITIASTPDACARGRIAKGLIRRAAMSIGRALDAALRVIIALPQRRGALMRRARA